MITWSIVYLALHVIEMPFTALLIFFLFSMISDVAIFFFIACAFKGFPNGKI